MAAEAVETTNNNIPNWKASGDWIDITIRKLDMYTYY
jgi:hypothetical protein